jgi:S1-C subfamily serine protease
MGVRLDVERGGAALTRVVAVSDFHALIPSCMLEVSGAVLHPVSYMAARNNALAVAGVFLSQPGYAFARAGLAASSVITAIGHARTPTLAAVEAALRALPDRAKVPLRYCTLGEAHRERVCILTVDRTWSDMVAWSRHDGGPAGQWRRRVCPPPPPGPPPAPQTARFPALPGASQAAAELARSLCLVEVAIPAMCDGVHASTFVGAGVVIDAAQGLVLTDRNTVPIACADVTLTFAASAEVPGTVVFLHPVHNLALVRFDRALLGETQLRTAELAPAAPAVGDSVDFVGLTASNQIVCQKVSITKYERVVIGDASPPRYRCVGAGVGAL